MSLQDTTPDQVQLRTLEELRMYETLGATAPRYAAAFLEQLPRARTVVLHRLLAALWREDVGAIRTASRRLDASIRVLDRVDAGALELLLGGVQPGVWQVHELDGTTVLAFPIRAEHAFNNVKPGDPVLCLRAGEATVIESPHDLVELMAEYEPAPGWQSFDAELADTVANLTLAYARSEEQRLALRQAAIQLHAPDTVGLAQMVSTREVPEDVMVFFERLNTEGHNLHPCGRGRLGMHPAALLRHDLESETSTDLILVGIRRERVESTPDERGRDVGQLLCAEYPRLDTAIRAHFRLDQLDPTGYVFLPVHAWQLDQVVRPLLADEIAERAVVPVPAARLAGVPTSSVRTLLTERSPAGRRLLVKTALDTLIGSTRRSISAHTTNNGPVYSRLLRQILDREPVLADRIVLLDELAGASYRPPAHDPDPDRRSRALSALVRSDISTYLRPDELPVPGCALPAGAPVTESSLLVELVTRYAATRGETDLGMAGLRFAEEYATLLLPVTVILMTKYGIAVEAHLQNCIFTFVGAVPTRLVLRDWGGMRIYPPRLRRQGLRLDPRPGTVTVTDDVHVMRAKTLYTVLSNHLGEVVAHLVTRCGVDPRAAWQRIRAVLEGLLAGLDADPALRENVAADRAVLLAPTVPIKAFARMRLDPASGDQYVQVRNPLHEGPEGPAWERVSAALRGQISGEQPVCAYVYDLGTLVEQVKAVRVALPERCELYYAIKANGHPAVLSTLAAGVEGFEVASLGEIDKALAAGASRLLFSGPAKTDAQIAGALRAGLHLLNVESMHELRRVGLIGAELGIRVPVALRVNRRASGLPGALRMAGTATPFGVDETLLAEALELVHALPAVALRGFHLHAVSNNLDADAHASFVTDSVAWCTQQAARHRINLDVIDVGGGIGVAYTGGDGFDLPRFADGLGAAVTRLPPGVRLIFELGRFLVAGAGWYAAEVLDLKCTHGRYFAVLRGGTHHFRLPAAWGYSHPFTVLPVEQWRYPFVRPQVRAVCVDVVGELCTPRDVLARQVWVERLRVGDIVVFPLAGAYGWEISHHDFLSHPHPAQLILNSP
jgi:diaminopimelate decarboxylase/siderophore synthetase component